MKKLLVSFLLSLLLSQPVWAINFQTGFDTGKLNANQVTVECSAFSGLLSCSDTDVQHALNTLDQASSASGPFILKNGGTTTTAPIPFAQGLTSTGTVFLNTPTTATAPLLVNTGSVAGDVSDIYLGKDGVIILTMGTIAGGFPSFHFPTTGSGQFYFGADDLSIFFGLNALTSTGAISSSVFDINSATVTLDNFPNCGYLGTDFTGNLNCNTFFPVLVVGDCTSGGSCFTGTSGSILTFKAPTSGTSSLTVAATSNTAWTLPKTGATAIVASIDNNQTFTGAETIAAPGSLALSGTYVISGAGQFQTNAPVFRAGLQLVTAGALTITDLNIVLGTTTGTKLGTAANQKIGAFGATPIVQPSGNICTAMVSLGWITSCTVTATTNANLTGPITSVGNATSIASQTGTGTTFVVDTAPTISAPTFTGAFSSSGVSSFTLTTDSTSNTTGGVLLSGGLGVAKSIFSGGNIATDVAGKGFKVKEGANAKMGTGTLVGGTVVVNTTAVTTNSRIFVTDTGGGVFANIGSLTVPTIVNATSFTVTSTNVLDTSTFNWIIFEPA